MTITARIPTEPSGIEEPWVRAGHPQRADVTVRRMQQLERHRLLAAWPIMVERGIVHPDEAELARLAAEQSARSEIDPSFDVELAEAFAHHGVVAMIAKGGLLARTCYPRHENRQRCDTDWLIDPSCKDAAKAAMASVGLRQINEQISGAEELWGPARADAHRSIAVDAHWQLVDHPAFTKLFDFGELWSRRAALGGDLYGLSQGDAILHAAAHYYCHSHANSFRPHIWLLDIDLLWRSLSAEDEKIVCDRAIAHGCAGILYSALREASGVFSTAVNPKTVARLVEHGDQEWQTVLTRDSLSWLQTTLLRLKGFSSWRQRIAYVQRILFPPSDYLRRKATKPDQTVIGLHASRLFRALIQRMTRRNRA